MSDFRYCQICGVRTDDAVHFLMGECRVCGRPTHLCFVERCYLCERQEGELR